MSDSAANEEATPLAKLLALNGQLAALDEAGAELGLGVRGGELRTRLAKLSEELPGRLNSVGADSLSQTLEFQATAVSPAYARLVEAWLSGGDLGELLATQTDLATSIATGRSRLTLQLAYPLFVATLACVGLAFTCYTTLPLLESTYTDLREPVSFGVSWLQSLRAVTPIWLVGVPAILLLGLVWLRRGKPLRLTRSSRDLGAMARGRFAQMSELVASLIDVGVDRDAALNTAAVETHGKPSRKPPLLDWASQAVAPDAVASGNFRAIGAFYRDLARRGVERVTNLTPLVACVVIGGGATLLYGLALFVPLVELFWTLAF